MKKSNPTFIHGTEGKVFALNRAAKRIAAATGMQVISVPMRPLERIVGPTGVVNYRLNGVFPCSVPYQCSFPLHRRGKY